MSVKQTTLGSS